MTHEHRVVEPVDHVHEPAVVERPVVDRVTTGPSTATVLRRVVTLLFGILQAMIVLRIVLLLLAANPDNGIVALIYGATDPFVDPFRGMFNIDAVRGRTDSVLDVGAIVALVGWTLIELLILVAVTDCIDPQKS